MPNNTTKNVLISVALIAFIISSGAFTIYQLAKKQTINLNNSQTSSLTNGNATSDAFINSNSNTQTKELSVSFDPYVCGLSITGFVDKPDIILNLEINLFNKDKLDIKQTFTPKIDALKNFKILVDEKIIVDGVYKLEAKAYLTNQKTEISDITLEFKNDCSNLIQNSTPSTTAKTSNQIITSITSSQSEIKIESSMTPTVRSSQVSIIQSEVPRQTVEAPVIPKTLSSPSASSALSLADSTNNPNSVRTGGLDFTILFIILMIIVSTLVFAKLNTKQTNINEIFGKK